MTPISAMVASMAAAVLLFGFAAHFTRATTRRILISLAGGALFAVGNIGWDVAAQRMGWWRYSGGMNPLWYLAVAVGVAGIGLIAWRIDRRWGTRGLRRLIFAFALYGLVRDFALGRFVPDLIVFGGGPIPWIADLVAWLMLTSMAIALAVVIEPIPQNDTLRD